MDRRMSKTLPSDIFAHLSNSNVMPMEHAKSIVNIAQGLLADQEILNRVKELVDIEQDRLGKSAIKDDTSSSMDDIIQLSSEQDLEILESSSPTAEELGFELVEQQSSNDLSKAETSLTPLRQTSSIHCSREPLQINRPPLSLPQFSQMAPNTIFSSSKMYCSNPYSPGSPAQLPSFSSLLTSSSSIAVYTPIETGESSLEAFCTFPMATACTFHDGESSIVESLKFRLNIIYEVVCTFAHTIMKLNANEDEIDIVVVEKLKQIHTEPRRPLGEFFMRAAIFTIASIQLMTKFISDKSVLVSIIAEVIKQQYVSCFA